MEGRRFEKAVGGENGASLITSAGSRCGNASFLFFVSFSREGTREGTREDVVMANASGGTGEVHVLLVDDDRITRLVVAGLLRKCNYRGEKPPRSIRPVFAVGPETQRMNDDVVVQNVNVCSSMSLRPDRGHPSVSRLTC